MKKCEEKINLFFDAEGENLEQIIEKFLVKMYENLEIEVERYDDFN